MNGHHIPPAGEKSNVAAEAQVPAFNVRHRAFFNRLYPHDKQFALISQNVINALIREGFINPHNLKNIFEFGAGIGASTIALAELAKINGAEIDVAESIPEKAEWLFESGLVPDENIFVGDGMETLGQITRNGHQYDLIYAAMFFPDGQKPMSQRFLEIACRALGQGGNAVIYSDRETIAEVLDACTTGGFHYQQLTAPLSTDPLFSQVQDILIVSNPAQTEGSSP